MTYSVRVLNDAGDDKARIAAEQLIAERGLPTPHVPEQIVWVAEHDDGTLVGAATAMLDQSPPDHRDPAAIAAPHAAFRELAVRVDFERRGIGKALIEARLSTLSECNQRSVSAEPRDQNSRRLLARCGFSPAHPANSPYASSSTMVRPLP
jgi:GNAT superfamily N-acetyltransferase